MLRSHRWRTATNSAAYLLPHLQPGHDAARRRVRAGDAHLRPGRPGRRPARSSAWTASAEVVAAATAEAAERGTTNVTFDTGDVYALPFADDRFDVVHAHQVLQHLTEPVAALRELRRVVRPDGVVAVRDSDYAAMTWAPDEPRLDRWLDLYHQVTERNGAEADAGRYLKGWARAAGFAEVEVGSSTWTFAVARGPGLVGGAVGRPGRGRPTPPSPARPSSTAWPPPTSSPSSRPGWRSWAEADDGVFAVVHFEVLARG